MSKQQQQLERAINDRIESEMSKRLRAEENLQNELKWLKIELKEERTRERINKLEIQTGFYIALGVIIAVITLIN